MAIIVERSSLLKLASFLNDLLDSTNDTSFTFDQIQIVWSRERDASSMVETDPAHNHVGDTTNINGILRTLRTLVLSFEKQRALARLRINRRGIYSLPDEVMSVIMEHAVSSYDEARSLSHVCSWFRAVILATREIWANVHLSQDLHPEEVRLIVQRNDGMALRVRLQAEPQTPPMQRILRHAAHLEELYMAISDDLNDDERLDNLCLPVLRKLTLRKRDGGTDPYFYRTWNMPRLEHLDMNSILTIQPRASLRFVKLSLDKYFHVNQLIEVLDACHLLSALDISLLKGPGITSANARILRLQNLKTLAIRDWTIGFAYIHILDALVVDTLSEFTIMLGTVPLGQQIGYTQFDPDQDLVYHINVVYGFANRHSMLRKFNMHVEVIDHPLEDIPSHIFEHLYLPLSGLPKGMETSIISSPFRTLVIYWETAGQQLEIRRARCIRVRGEGFTVDLFCDLGDSSLWKGAVPRRVEVDYNVPIEEEMIRAAFPESEIVYVS